MFVKFWYIFFCYERYLPQCHTHIDIRRPVTQLPCGTLAFPSATANHGEQLKLITLQVHKFFGIQVVFHRLEILLPLMMQHDCKTFGIILISQGKMLKSLCNLLTIETIETINNIMLVKIPQPMLIKQMLAKFQTVYENSPIWNNVGDTLEISFHSMSTVTVVFDDLNSGRSLGTNSIQTFSTVSGLSDISNALEYRYQFRYFSGIGQLSSHGYIVFDSIPFGNCYFALRYGETEYEKYPGLEFHASNYTWKQIPYISNMTNLFTYATVRVSDIRVTWEMKIVFNEDDSLCLTHTVPWITVNESLFVIIDIARSNIGEYHRIYYNTAPGYTIGMELISVIKLSCNKWGLTAYSNVNDCSKSSYLGPLCEVYSHVKHEYILPFRFAIFETYLLSNIGHPIGDIKLRLYSTKCKTINICGFLSSKKTKAYVGYFDMFPVIRLFHQKYRPIEVANEPCLWYSIPSLSLKRYFMEHCAIRFILPNDQRCSCQINSNIPYPSETNGCSFDVQLYRHPNDAPLHIPYGDFKTNITVIESLYVIWSGNCFYAIFRLKFVIENIKIIKLPQGFNAMTLRSSHHESQIRFQFKSVLNFRYINSQKFARIKEEFWLQHFSWFDVQLMNILKDQIPHFLFEIIHDCQQSDIELHFSTDTVTSTYWEQCLNHFTMHYFGRTAHLSVTLKMKKQDNCAVLFSQKEVFLDHPLILHTINPVLIPKRVCPFNYTNLEDICLMLLDLKRLESWDTYQSSCQQTYGALVTISNKAKSRVVKSFLQIEGGRHFEAIQYAPVFIGLKRKRNKKVGIVYNIPTKTLLTFVHHCILITLWYFPAICRCMGE